MTRNTANTLPLSQTTCKECTAQHGIITVKAELNRSVRRVETPEESRTGKEGTEKEQNLVQLLLTQQQLYEVTRLPRDKRGAHKNCCICETDGEETQWRKKKTLFTV